MYTKSTIFALFTLSTLLFSCSSDDNGGDVIDDTAIEAPATYTFTRDGESTVSFSGQTTRIEMAEELVSAIKDFDVTTEQLLLDMFANENNPFSNSELNASSKSIKSKVAASEDYFSNSATISSGIRATFELHLSKQTSEVFPNEGTAATPGIAGQIADGDKTRYVNAKGLEYDQAFAKSLIGGLMTDQALNNYLGTAVLDAGNNVADNNAGTTLEDKPYTNMEHKWDEAYGYLYGTSVDATNPNTTIGDDDSFLNKYIGRVENDSDDFGGIAKEIFDAFKLGRAAIVGKDYELRDAQAQIIREKISEVIGVRSVYYLQQGKNAVEANDLGAAFHDLSEGYGFIYSLQFTRKPGTNEPYFTKSEVEGYINELMTGNGFWEITPTTLDAISTEIASRFSFTVEQAKE